MTVKDIIKTLSMYEPETEVKITSGPFISEIISIRPITDIDTNKKIGRASCRERV